MRSTAWILAAAVSATLASGVLADDAATTAPDITALKAQIDALQKQVEKVQAQQAQQQEQTAAAAAVAADAARQSQMFQTQPFTAGYNNGFKIQSADGNTVLQPGLVFQFRNVTNYNHSNNDDLQNGFEFRRLRPRMDGTLFTKDLQYSVVLDTGRNLGTMILLDAWAKYNFTKEWGLKLGQFRNSYVHEGDVADTRQLAVERSLVDGVLLGSITDRVQGVEGVYSPEGLPMTLTASLNDGDNSKNTDFRDNDPGAATDISGTGASRVNSNYGASARVQYKFFGDWDNYKDFTAKGVKQDLLVAGAGIDYSEGGDSNVVRSVADLQYENAAGWSAFGQFAYVYRDVGNGQGRDNDLGLTGQVGYLINPKIEPFARYSYVHYEESPNSQDNFHEITVGTNYYFGPDGVWSYDVKFSVDLNYLPSGAPGNVTGDDYLNSTQSEVVLRAQFQLVL